MVESAQREHEEEPLMTFGSALNAIMWAYEKCSCMGGYARSGIIPPSSKRDPGRAPWPEVVDFALTITSTLAQIQPPIASQTLQTILEPPELANIQRFQEVVAAVADSGVGAAGELVNADTLRPSYRAMAAVAVLRVRHETQHPKSPIRPPISAYARALNVSRSTVYEKRWDTLRKEMEGAARSWRDTALSALGTRLQFDGIVRSNAPASRS